MKTIFSIAIGFCLTVGLALGASSVRGDYIEARTADVFVGACFANSEVGATGELAVLGWKITKGTWEGVNLDGLSVVGAVKAKSTLGDIHSSPYPVKSILIVDEKATPEQRLALQSFAKRMGGDLLNDVVRVSYLPIELAVEGGNVHSATAKLTAGTLASIETRSMSGKDHVCANAELWYLPLTKVEHAMPAFAVSHNFKGDGLDTKWSSPDKASAFVASFQYRD
ncbi:MAG: DUF1326 domain-containing protein [Acidobacteriia bacterium]|nr:DUF1326 domain-containing protein [Terriglobia bacterium]